MADLLRTGPLGDRLPFETAGCRLSEIVYDRVVRIAPFSGREAEVSEALLKAAGCAFPGPNAVTGNGKVRLVSVGPGEAYLFGEAPAIEGAAMVEAGDGLVGLLLEGDVARDVLSRVTPLDLRDRSFPVGTTARTLIGQIAGSVLRRAETEWEVIVPRSMAESAVRDLTRAMSDVAARSLL